MAKKRKLNLLPHQLTVTAFGVGIRLQAEHRVGLSRFAKALPFGCEPCAASSVDRVYSIVQTEQGTWRLYADSRKVAECADAAEMKRRLRAHAQLFIAATSQQFVFIHAGVVALGEQAVIIPGRSYSGKTTLVAELVKAGAVYYSDEYALLDEQGRVHPYPRPLSVRAKRTKIQADINAEKLGAQIGQTPLPVRLVLLTFFRPGANWQPVLGGMAEAIKGLAENAVAIRRFPAATLKAIAQVAAGASVMQGFRGEAHEVVRLVRLHLESC